LPSATGKASRRIGRRSLHPTGRYAKHRGLLFSLARARSARTGNAVTVRAARGAQLRGPSGLAPSGRGRFHPVSSDLTTSKCSGTETQLAQLQCSGMERRQTVESGQAAGGSVQTLGAQLKRLVADAGVNAVSRPWRSLAASETKKATANAVRVRPREERQRQGLGRRPPSNPLTFPRLSARLNHPPT
jgi:hypothetical protein